MKKLLVILLLFNIANVKSQDYSTYYTLCNLSDSLQYVGLDKQAYDTLKTAFETVDYVHSGSLKKALQLAIKLNKFEEAGSFGKQLLINSGDKKSVKSKSAAFKKSIHYKKLIDSSDVYLEAYNKRINHDYIKIIDSLFYVDQNIIRKNRSVKGKYNIDLKNLPSNKFELDKELWAELSLLIDSLGFPSEQNVGAEAYFNAMIVIHHNLRLKENEAYHPRIIKYIIKGEYLPIHFSFWYEQYNRNIIGNTYFTLWDENLSEENLKRIDNNRRKFYLKGINSFRIKGNGRIMKRIW
jgi:hypothetical protein